MGFNQLKSKVDIKSTYNSKIPITHILMHYLVLVTYCYIKLLFVTSITLAKETESERAAILRKAIETESSPILRFIFIFTRCYK